MPAIPHMVFSANVLRFILTLNGRKSERARREGIDRQCVLRKSGASAGPGSAPPAAALMREKLSHPGRQQIGKSGSGKDMVDQFQTILLLLLTVLLIFIVVRVIQRDYEVAARARRRPGRTNGPPHGGGTAKPTVAPTTKS
jgi:hypothetical protein